VIKYIYITLFIFSFDLNTAQAGDLLGPSGRNGSVPGGRGRGGQSNTNGPCSIRNSECTSSGSHVQIDLAAQCMCVGSTCVEVGIGMYGPNQTRNGTGVLGPATGGLYNGSRFSPPGTTRWHGTGNEDGLSMGIPQNDRGASATGRNLAVTNGGKWIHKTANCNSPARAYATAGCVAVSCEDWPLIKAATGQTVTVCGGASTDGEIVSRYGCTNARRCSAGQRQAPLAGCSRSYSRLMARGQRPAGECVNRAGQRVSFPGLSGSRADRINNGGIW